MKKIIVLLLLCILSKNVLAQTTATKEHIKELLELTGAAKIGIQMMENMNASFKQTLPSVPTEFWDEMMKEVSADELIELIIPIYAKYYSDEEIVKLIEFYKTPLGKKVTEKLPLITQDSYAAGQQWGRSIGEKVAKKLIEKGYSETKE